MRTFAMPSPRGTNRAGLTFVEYPRGRGAAYDSAMSIIDPKNKDAETQRRLEQMFGSDDDGDPRKFLQAKLSADDLAEYDRLSGANGGRKADAATMAKTDRVPGMDAKIRIATDAARREAIAEMNAIADAERDVLPFIGKPRSRATSAAAVYKLALDAQGVDLRGVPTAAYRAIVRNLPQHGARRPSPAASSSAPSIAGLDRIRLA